MTQVLAAFLVIPYGLSVLMRGSDGLNRGRYTRREAGVMAGLGGGLILASLVMLMGLRYAGILVAAGLLLSAALALRQSYQRTGFVRPGELAGRGLFAAFLIVLIVAAL